MPCLWFLVLLPNPSTVTDLPRSFLLVGGGRANAEDLEFTGHVTTELEVRSCATSLVLTPNDDKYGGAHLKESFFSYNCGSV